MRNRAVVAGAVDASAVQSANWSGGSIPVVLSLAPTSLSTPAMPPPRHQMVSRHTYLHVGLRGEVMALFDYAPGFGAAGAGGGGVVAVREEPPDSLDGGPTNDGGRVAQHPPSPSDTPYPECWFEDVESGRPLQWQLFVGVLYDLMRGRFCCDGLGEGDPLTNDDDGGGGAFLPWKVRVHFTSYPAKELLPLDAADAVIPLLVERTFRNSLKQALFLQHGSSKVAMSLSKHSHEKMWDAILRSNYSSYREVDVDLHHDVGGTACAGDGTPRRIPVRVLVNGAPAMQRPCNAFLATITSAEATTENKNRNGDDKGSRSSDANGAVKRSPTTLGHLLAEWLPHLFETNASSGCATKYPPGTAYFVQGVRPALSTSVVDLWRALCHPDHFLYVAVVNGS